MVNNTFVGWVNTSEFEMDTTVIMYRHECDGSIIGSRLGCIELASWNENSNLSAAHGAYDHLNNADQW